MLYMIVERFKNGDPLPVYRRFREQGRLMPDGVEYRGSWVTEDLVDFEVIPVTTSAEALASVTPRL